MSYPHIITSQVITVIYENRPLQVTSTTPQYQLVLEAITSRDWDTAIALMDVKTSMKKWAKDGFTITEEHVLHNGQKLPPVLEARIIGFWQEGRPFQPLLNFFERLNNNPSGNSVKQLYKFLEHGNMPIDDEGYFYGYKGLRDNYTDCHTGHFDNKPGQAHSVPRNQVDDDPARGCSYGFHVGSLNYATGFGSRTVIVRVDPANVVSVPHDCNHQKLRCSEYTVVADYVSPLPENKWDSDQTASAPCDLDSYEFDDTWNDDFDGWSIREIEEEFEDADMEMADAIARRQKAVQALTARNA